MKRSAISFLVIFGLCAGFAAQARQVEALPRASSRVDHLVVATTDPAPAHRGWAFVARVVDGGTRIGVLTPGQPDAVAGDTLEVSGSLRPGLGRLHRNDVAGWLTGRDVAVVARAAGLMGAANSVRSRVHGLFAAEVPEAALMRGFLIGDTAAIPELDIEEMKRAGLVHFVAVSGGNVALFLGAVWLALGLIPLGPRQRAAVGLIAVLLFVLVTRWEPSVVRAGLMIGLVLAGRLLGVPVAGWTALGAAITLALLVSPELIFDVGFQLSVLATAGLMFGSGLWGDRRPRPLWRALGATFSAQLAVSPLLIVSFASVPAFSALTNVLAAPLVSSATALGWAATFFDLSPLADVAASLAGGVLALSQMAAALPQVGVFGVVAIVAGALALSWRPAVGAVAVAAALVIALMPAGLVSGPVIVFLDVGQGDAAILRTHAGHVIAVDTGPDPVVYSEALRRQRITHIDLLVLTHSDGDHVGGLDALDSRVSVDRVWRPSFTDDELWDRLLAGFGADTEDVRAGTAVELDEFRVSVLSPARRFAGDNDGSIVLWIDSGHRTALLGGDVEAVAQRELPAVRPDVLLVPHHGSRTSDTDWLHNTVGRYAVLSYGRANSFGHPAQEIVDALQSSGAAVLETANGDVVVSLGRYPQAAPLGIVANRRASVSVRSG